MLFPWKFSFCIHLSKYKTRPWKAWIPTSSFFKELKLLFLLLDDKTSILKTLLTLVLKSQVKLGKDSHFLCHLSASAFRVCTLGPARGHSPVLSEPSTLRTVMGVFCSLCTTVVRPSPTSVCFSTESLESPGVFAVFSTDNFLFISCATKILTF